MLSSVCRLLGFDFSLNAFQRREPHSVLARRADPCREVYQLQPNHIADEGDLYSPLWPGVHLSGECGAQDPVQGRGACGWRSVMPWLLAGRSVTSVMWSSPLQPPSFDQNY